MSFHVRFFLFFSVGVQAERSQRCSGLFRFGRDGYDVVTNELRPLFLYPVLNERPPPTNE